MSFGLDVYDSNGRKSFDHNRKVMKIYDHLKIPSSAFIRTNNAGLYDDYNYSKMATVVFNKVIKTKYPPMLFARTKGTLILGTTRYIGSEFNWTGAYLGHGNLGIRQYGGKGTSGVDNNSDFEIVVCGFESFSTPKSFGLQVFNESGETIFNTEDRVAVLKNVGIYGWEKYYEHGTVVGGSPYRYYYRKRVNMAQSDFFQMSGLCWGGVYFGSNFSQDVHGGIFKSEYNYLRYEIKGSFFGPGFDENPVNYRSTMILDGSRIPWL